MRKLVALSIFLLTLVSLHAQNGIIRGKVTTSDNQGAPGVTIEIKSLGKTTITNDIGSYEFRNITPGDHALSVSYVGYTSEEKTVTVAYGAVASLDFQLSINNRELGEVIVSSNTRNTVKAGRTSNSLRLQGPLIELPQNIQVVTGKNLTDQQIISMSDGLIRNVSGAVRLEHWGDMYTNISMRGSQIQAFRNGFNVVSSYWGPLTEDMSFVDHIEFVKGPAGFMLANGDPSGLYNVVTKKPTGVQRGEASFTVGSFGLYRTAVDLDGKLSKDGRLLYRLNLAGQNKGSHRPLEYNDRYSIAPVISYQLDEKTKLTAEYVYQFAKMSNVGSYYIFGPNGYATTPVDFTMMAAGLEPTKMNDHTITLNLQHQLSTNWKLTAQASYLKYTQVGSSAWPTSVAADGKVVRAVSIWDAESEMGLAQAFINGDAQTGSVRHRILAGLDMGTKKYMADWSQYHDLDTAGGEFDPANPYFGPPNNGYPVWDRTTPLEARAALAGGLIDQQYTGLYLQDELGFFNNKLRLTLAGRFTSVSQSAWGESPDKADRITPRIGLSYSIDKNFSVYALYDQAFIPQTGRIFNGDKVRPITGNNQEIGIKKDWANGKWNTTVSVYRILKENELTTDPNQPLNSGYSIVLGQKKVEGFEIDVRGKLAPGLTLVANYAYTDAIVSKVAAGIDPDVYEKGDVVPGFAKQVANGWLTYRIQDGVLRNLGFSAGFTAQMDRRTDSWSDTDVRLPDYFKFDGGVSWENDKLRIGANVFNIFDRYLYSGSYYSWLNAFYWQTDPPRNFRFEVAYKF